MRTQHPKPQSLRPLSARHRRWFWVLMLVGALLILVGWMLTVRDLLTQAPTIKSSFEQGVNRAAQEIEDAQLDPSQKIDEVSEALEALQAGYNAEKQRQQETTASYEQEDTTP